MSVDSRATHRSSASPDASSGAAAARRGGIVGWLGGLAERMGPEGGRPPRGFSLIPAVIIVLATLNVTVPYLAQNPGPTTDVNKIIEIKGVPTYGADGKLLLTTVALSRYKLRVVDTIRAALDGDIDVIPITAFIPPGKTPKEVDRENAAQIDESKRVAAAAALKHLGYPVKVAPPTARVTGVLTASPSAGKLETDDIITAVDGQEVTDGSSVVRLIRRRRVGDEISVTVLRNGAPVRVTMKTRGRPDDPSVPAIGVEIRTYSGTIELPVGVDFRTGRGGGPSAGLMFALGVVELLQPAQLTQGRSIAGTGTIDMDGNVGDVGGIRQKIAGAIGSGAKVFLCPAGEADDARRAADGRIRVVAVRTLADAVSALSEPATAEGVVPPRGR